MKEKWFIYKGDYHTGPYTLLQVKNFYSSGELDNESIIWKEGAHDWMPFKNWDDFKQSQKKAIGPPEFIRPPAKKSAPENAIYLVKENVTVDEIDEYADEAFQEVQFDQGSSDGVEANFSEVPSLPQQKVISKIHWGQILSQIFITQLFFIKKTLSHVLVYLKSLFKTENNAEKKTYLSEPIIQEEEQENTVEENDELTNEPFVMTSFHFGGMVIVLGFLLITFSLFDWGAAKSEYVFKGIIPEKSDRLHQVLDTVYHDQQGKWVLETRSDLSGIWLATNFDQKALVTLYLSSIKDKLIGKDKVTIIANAKLSNGVAYFDKIKLLKGERILNGVYDYTLRIKKENSSPFPDMMAADTNEDMFQVKGTILYYGGSQASFKVKFNDYWKKKDVRSKKILDELAEKNRTLVVVLDKIKNLYENSLKNITKGIQIRTFEISYLARFSPLLKDMLIDNRKRASQFQNAGDTKNHKYFNDLVVNIKAMAFLSALMVEKTEQIEQLNLNQKLMLQSLFSRKIQEILLVLKDKSEKLNGEL